MTKKTWNTEKEVEYIKGMQSDNALIVRELKLFFNEQRKRIIRSLEEKQVNYNVNQYEEQQKLEKRFLRIFPLILGGGWAFANRLVRGESLRFVLAPFRSRLDLDTKEFARLVTQTTFKDLDRIVKRGIEEGLGTQAVANNITGLYDETYRGRYLRIAQTETTKWRNMAANQRYGDSKVVDKKRWNITGFNTRQWHVSADGQTVNTNEPFYVDGEELDYPGDPSGSAANIINCRCFVTPVISGVNL